MYSPEFMKFLIGKDVETYNTEKETKREIKTEDNKVFRYKRYATIPIEIKE